MYTRWLERPEAVSAQDLYSLPFLSEYILTSFLDICSNTDRYMAPEVFKHRKYDKKVDIFSFAMILYEVVLPSDLQDSSVSYQRIMLFFFFLRVCQWHTLIL
jgi:serine/threonine protein kinase